MAEVPTKAQMMQLITGYFVSQAIHAAAELEIADKLASGPKSAEELADLTNSPSENVYRLLRALSSIGIFEEIDKRFHLTPLAEHLRKDSPETVWTAAILMGDEFYKAWSNLTSSIRTDRNGWEETFGMPPWQYLTERPERGLIFDKMMDSFHGHETSPILNSYDFSRMQRVVDVGAGHGDVIAALLRNNPGVQGVLFDLPEVIMRAQAAFANDAIFERCQFEGGDFFREVPEGGDAYILRHVIHDWDDERAIQILKCCRTAMPESGRLLVIEGVIPKGDDPSSYKWLDLSMMVALNGKERTKEQYKDLYRQAGFEFTRVIPTTTEVSLIEGVPV